MKKFFKSCAVLIITFSLLILAGCFKGKYEKYAGTYECNLIMIASVNYTSQYEYYTIILDGNGNCTITSKGVNNSTTYSADATFEIEDGIIRIFTKNGTATITEEYSITDSGVITMRTTINGSVVYATFIRAEEE